MSESERTATEEEVRELRERVSELERVVSRHLDVSVGPRYELPTEPQTTDCWSCGEEFEVNVENGLQCPHCDALQSEETDA